ncbi:hypothetical protein NBO_443g0002 [Nosema bombycis CQ1]|uniref:Uncharacterized protein n=1 Tax=Nosema bombycis (strain CQ1 / CVCC 102059) TaxID=578461 RepID=R0M360_NOSB1|nr:hypothetical protein NBO_443g0002 [Nosema bombycis CQ1]|eukprot:EOB12439.1 hypothetical protein NBO_443g0002 [Nosema bombycis CQ1]
MNREITVGEATNALVFLNMNWNVIDANDIFKLCEDIVTLEKIKTVKICKTKAGERTNEIGACKDLKEYQSKTLQILKSSFVALVVFDSVQPAIKIYNELDSTELENSGMFFDIRFVDENIKTGEVTQTVTSCEGFVEKDYNKFKIEETPAENKRGKLLEKLFTSKNTNEKLLNELISISDNEEENEDIIEKKKLLFEEVEKEKDEVKIEIDKPVKEVTTQEKKSASSHVFDPLDSRFSMLYTDSDFTIDPTHPEYQKNNKLKDIMKEKRRRFEEKEM